MNRFTRRGFALFAATVLGVDRATAGPSGEAPALLRLTISSDSRYTLDGKPVPRDGLLPAFKAGRTQRGFDLEITASSRTPYDAIALAISRAHEAGVGSLKFRQPEDPGPAASAPTPDR